MSVDDLKREVAEGWPNMPAATYALGIIDFMQTLDDQELRMLTVPILMHAVDCAEVNHEFLAALAILAGSTVHVLDAKALYTEDDEEEFGLDAGELAEARRTGFLEHQSSGELIEDFESKLIPYFESSERFLEARTND
jgi:hypothetical protein